MNDGTSTAPDSKEFAITVWDSIAEAETVWRGFEAASDHYVFQTYDWLSLWHTHIGVHEGVDPRIVLVSDRDDLPIILMPLAIEKRSGIRRLTWLGGTESDYHAPLLAKGLSARLDDTAFLDIWAQALESLPPADVVFLERQPATICEQRNPFLALDCVRDLENAYFTRLEGKWEQYYQSKRSRKTRKRIRNYENALLKHGELNFEVLGEPKDIRTVLAELFVLKSRRHRETGVRDLINEVGRKEFFTKAVLEAPYNQRVKIAVLKSGADTAAATLLIHYNSRLYDVLPVHDTERFGKYGVGIIFLTKTMKWAFDSNIDIYDFTIGDDEYKGQWCEGTVPLFHYMNATTAKGWILTIARKLRSRLREVAWLKSGLRAVRSFATRLRT